MNLSNGYQSLKGSKSNESEEDYLNFDDEQIINPL
jgi:hypothetical protein